MKKIYFAGKFNLLKDKNKTLEDRLVNDYRSKLLKSARKMTYAQNNLMLNNDYQYLGPFYCEEASKGNFTSTDCNVVLNSEYKYVENCDIFLVVFGEDFSVGSVVELGWALNMNKEIVILYLEEDSNYNIKSEYWFAIADALKRTEKIKIYSYKEDKEIQGLINNEVLVEN